MTIPNPKIGLVINYSYLWEKEAAKGQTEGIKDRPCLIVGAKTTDNDTTVLVAPITHSAPTGREDIEIPAAVKSRLGLDDEKSWVVTSEVNRFTWSQSPDLRPISRNEPGKFEYGMAPENMTRAVQAQIKIHSSDKTLSVTGRDDDPEPTKPGAKQMPPSAPKESDKWDAFAASKRLPDRTPPSQEDSLDKSKGFEL